MDRRASYEIISSSSSQSFLFQGTFQVPFPNWNLSLQDFDIYGSPIEAYKETQLKAEREMDVKMQPLFESGSSDHEGHGRCEKRRKKSMMGQDKLINHVEVER